ncbi:acyltransferase [Mesorhizobium sp. ES1-4]|nr:acyltransferase [Mesorhizobium sp. ES1-4]MBZ9794739.1 acyltransferase [Mesorhizobium sp. ES1-4]
MRTIGDVLDRNKGIGPGFDFLRIALAMSVLFAHSFLIAEGERFQYSTAPLALMHASIIPMFFALSGFLITGSAMRLRLKDFILNRGMRIVPALAMDIFFAAIVIGPIFTTLSLKEYFSNYEFASYFANILGLIHYVLPGVFENNPFPNTVNGSLWTVPFEIGCYVLMALVIVTGLLKHPRILLCAALVFALFVFISRLRMGSLWWRRSDIHGHEPFPQERRQSPLRLLFRGHSAVSVPRQNTLPSRNFRRCDPVVFLGGV